MNRKVWHQWVPVKILFMTAPIDLPSVILLVVHLIPKPNAIGCRVTVGRPPWFAIGPIDDHLAGGAGLVVVVLGSLLGWGC